MEVKGRIIISSQKIRVSDVFEVCYMTLSMRCIPPTLPFLLVRKRLDFTNKEIIVNMNIVTRRKMSRNPHGNLLNFYRAFYTFGRSSWNI